MWQRKIKLSFTQDLSLSSGVGVSAGHSQYFQRYVYIPYCWFLILFFILFYFIWGGRSNILLGIFRVLIDDVCSLYRDIWTTNVWKGVSTYSGHFQGHRPILTVGSDRDLSHPLSNDESCSLPFQISKSSELQWKSYKRKGTVKRLSFFFPFFSSSDYTSSNLSMYWAHVPISPWHVSCWCSIFLLKVL